MKFTKGIIASFLVLAVMATASVAAAYTHSVTLKMGSTGSQVSDAQTALMSAGFDIPAITSGAAKGYFGTQTKTAVMAFQTANGLGADGIVGLNTGAKLSGAVVMTQDLCPNGNTVASSCMTPPAGTPTGPTCPNGNLVSNNCGAGTTPSPSGPLAGGAGDITVSGLSTYSSEEVGEGQSDVKVLAFEIEADNGSDVQINSVKVELFQQTGADSDRMKDYMDSVSVWMGSTKVGSSDTSDFSESSDIYSKSIALNGAVIKAGKTQKFILAIDSVGSLDSGDIDTDDWQIGVSSVRFMDADGVVTTEAVSLDIDDDTVDDEVEQRFDFADFATANDVELEADLTSENPDEGVIIGDSNDSTEVLMLSFDFKADGSDMNIEELEFDIVSSGADTDEVASELILKWGSEDSTQSIPDAGATTDDIVFDDLDIDIDEGDTMKFEVWARIKDVDGAPLVNGDTFQVSLDISETVANDESGEDLASGDLTGSADGETQHIFTEAPQVTYVSSSITPVDNGSAASESATATLVVKIKALGGTIYLNGDDETTATKEGLGVIAQGADTLAAYEFVTSGDYTITNSGADNEYYKITENKTMTITINATITQAAAATVLGGIALDEVLFGTVVTDDTTRSANVMNWSDLLDSLKSPKTTLVGV